MEALVGKIRLISFVFGGAIAYYVTNVVMGVTRELSGSFARLAEPMAIRHGVPLAVGLLFFVWLVSSQKVGVWANEVIAEVSKVVWPSKNDTYAMTMVVTFLILLSGVILGIFDKFSLWMIRTIIEEFQ